MRRLVRVGKVDGVAVYLHWSTIAVATAILLLVPWAPSLKIVLLLSYFAVLLLHEWGHVAVARRRRCAAHAIEIYPIFGITRYSMPWSRFDDAVIAWGGVTAQCAVGIPLVLVASRQGFEGPELVNAAVAVLGHFSLLIAAFNLAPVAPLDGAKAWKVVPVVYRAVISGLASRPGRSQRKGSGRSPRRPTTR